MHESEDREEDKTATLAGVEPTSLPRRLPRGATVGRYVVVDFIDEGGMGVVYKAFDPELNRTLALKLVAIDPTLDSGSEASHKSRLVREAQALAKLSHPNVVAVYDVGPHEDGVFMAMEFIEGTTLRTYLRERHSQTEILEVLTAAGQGLAAAHAAGITHRDFKPSNVIIGTDRRVRVIDFGLARARTGAVAPDHVEQTTQARPAPPSLPDLLSSPITVAGSFVGTPSYMAPEQFTRQTADEKSDQFSFCVVLFEALYGTRPFDGRTKEERVENVTTGRIVRPDGREVPTWLDQVATRGLSPNPAHRYPSMDALLADLANDPAIARAHARAKQLRVAFAVAVLACASVASWAVWSKTKRERPMCEGSAQKLAGVWDTDVRQSVERSFGATGRSYAPDVWRTTSRTLDAYAAAWVAMHKDTCEATRMRGEQSEEILTLRMACLDERLRATKALTSLFTHADDEILQKAPEAAGRLDNIASCADLTALTAGVKPPSDAAARERVAALRERLAGPKALELAAKYDKGIDELTPVMPDIEALGYAPLTSEALLLLGDLHGGAGEHKPAEDALERALLLAEESKDDDVVARALASLAWNVGYEQAHHEQGLAWARLGRAATKRLGGDEELTATLLITASSIYKDQGNGQEAVRLAEEAFEIVLRVRGPGDVLTGAVYKAVGNAYLEQATYPEAREAYAHALEIYENALGSEHPKVAGIYNNLGILGRREGNFDASLESYGRALRIYENTLGPDHPRVAEVLNNMTKPLQRLGRYGDALADGKRALAIYDKRFGPDFADAAYALLSIGQAYLGLDRPADAIPNLERSLRLIQASTLPRDLAADARFALAKARWKTTAREFARKLAQQALDDYAANPGSEEDIADVKAWLASVSPRTR